MKVMTVFEGKSLSQNPILAAAGCTAAILRCASSTIFCPHIASSARLVWRPFASASPNGAGSGIGSKNQFSRALEIAAAELVVVTRHGKPVATIQGITEDDLEDLLLERSAKFWKMIERARKGQSLSLERVVKALASPSRKKPGRTKPGRRESVIARRGR